jgi:hypothetical protein
MKRFQYIIAAVALGLAANLLAAGTAIASTLINVTASGSTAGDATPQFPYQSSAAISFALYGDLTGVDFFPEFVCLTCEVNFYLTRNSIGPGSSLSDLVAVAPSITSASAPVFTGLDLTAGLYFVTAFVLDPNFLWIASSSPVITESAWASDGLDYFAQSGNLSYPPGSDFTVFTAGSFHYQLTGTPLAVPVPAAGLLFPLGLLMLLGAGRRKIQISAIKTQHNRRKGNYAGKAIHLPGAE